MTDTPTVPARRLGLSHRRVELSAWALLVTQVIHGLTPADTEAEGYMGLVGGLVLLIATMAAILGFRRDQPWARRLLFVTGLTVAAGFVAYHATPVTSPITGSSPSTTVASTSASIRPFDAVGRTPRETGPSTPRSPSAR
jgi:hypothetical protein